MKNTFLLLMCLPLLTVGQFTYIPDDNFEQVLINLNLDMVFDDYVETASIDTVTSLWVSSRNIADLTGISDFSALKELSCSENQIVNLDLSSNSQLYEVNCSLNQLVSLDLRNSNNQGLLYFSSMNNPSLNCISVSNIAWANNTWSKDTWSTFSSNCNPTGFEGYNNQKKLIKVLDIYGRNVTPKPNIPLLYIYSDGTAEKKLFIN